MKHKFVLFIVIIIFIFAACSQPNNQVNTIQIGYLANLTGPSGEYGLEGLMVSKRA